MTENIRFTSRPFHVVVVKKDNTLLSALGDLFPDGICDWVYLQQLNDQEDPLITAWDWEKKRWFSFYKSKIVAFVELQ